MKRILFLLVIFAVGIISNTTAQQLTAEKILLKVKANFDVVKDYSAMLTGKVNMERLKVPQMSVKLYFKQPNKFKTESKGTSFIPKNILDLNPGDLLTKFDPSLMGKENVDGKTLYKIRLVTKPEKGKQIRESFIWVDESRWTITKLEAFPMEGRKIEVLIESTVIEGKYVLPSKISAKFDFEQNTDSLAEKIYSPNRMPKKGMVELIYSDYQVNKGLSDEIFEKKKN
ncbi:MAG: outer membrane lipoprotein-sorting protein [Bacteroidota bacterium]|nr:outer membrane lipoprotein-sorting protein [Bacteroidota bacterium]